MRWWERSIGGRVRGRIITMLRRGERSADEIASELGVTNNAVRAQLAALEKDGIVRTARVRHSGAVGKPTTLFEIDPSAQPLLSAAYPVVLEALLASLGERLGRQDLHELFHDVGHRLFRGTGVESREAAPHVAQPLAERVQLAARTLASLGAEIDVETTETGFTLRGYACPISAAVRAEPGACETIRTLVSGITGVEAIERCDRGIGTAGPARCCFEISAVSSAP